MRFLVFVTDAFGGRGGIAKFNRDLLAALCTHPAVHEVVALPRLVPDVPGAMPDALLYAQEAAQGKPAYLAETLRRLAGPYRFDGIVCGHLHLLPLACLAAEAEGVPLLLVIHGVEAWQPTRHRLANRLTQRVDAFVSVSRFTKEHFLRWARLAPDRGHVIPNTVDLARFSPGPKRPDLLARYGLAGRTVLLTLARLSAQDRYKGIDEVLDVMPALVEERPDLAYLVAGDGDDRPRLEHKARALGLGGRVIFTGYVAEPEKVDHYRLADAFVMPGRGEGFGIVYLEAMACGIAALASTADASREAVQTSALGLVVDPNDPRALRAGIHEALRRTNRRVPDGLRLFTFEHFARRWHDVIDRRFPTAVPRAA